MKNVFLVMTVLVIFGAVTSSALATWTLFGVDGDTATPAIPGPGTISSAANSIGPALTFVLDMGSAVSANQIMFKNSPTGTWWTIKKLDIYVAPDETAGGFVAGNISSYSNFVGNGTSDSYAANFVSYFDITQVTKRYYMMSVTEVPAGPVSDGTGIWFNDIQAVPEPATMALLGIGSLALLRRRKN